jgi:hypothetical protein
MDKTTATIVVLGILALVFIAFFAVFRKSGKGKIKGPFGTGLEVEGSNEAQQTQIKEVEAGGNIHINEAGGRGVEAYKLKAGGDVVIGSLATAKVETEKPKEERNAAHVVTPKEIMDRVNAAPPFQKDDVKQYYVGLMVDWEGKLYSVKKAKMSKFEVYISVDIKEDSYSFWLCRLEVSSVKYPELKVLHKDHPMRVVGKICEIDNLNIISIEKPALLFK